MLLAQRRMTVEERMTLGKGEIEEEVRELSKMFRSSLRQLYRPHNEAVKIAILLLERLWKAVLSLIDRQVGAAERGIVRTQQALKEEIEGCKRQVQEECEVFLEKWHKSEETYRANVDELQRQITVARTDKFAAEDLVKQQQIDMRALERIAENLKVELAGEVHKRNAK